MNDESQEIIQGTAPEASAEETPVAQGPAEETAKEPEAHDDGRRFGQDEVNSIVKERLDRQAAAFLKRLGIESMDGVEAILGRASEYESAKAEAESLRTEMASLKEEMALSSNRVREDRKEDVRAYFKGKGLDLTADNLKKEMASHPEWGSRPTTITTLTPEKTQPKPVDEWERAKRLFGL